MSLSSHELQKKISSNGRGPLTPKKYSNSALDAASVERIRVDEENDIDKVYQMGEVLGKGAFGVVREVTNRETGEKHAMKIVPKNKVGILDLTNRSVGGGFSHCFAIWRGNCSVAHL